MDSVRNIIAQYLRAAWRRRWMGVMVAWLVCGIGWVGVYLIPILTIACIGAFTALPIKRANCAVAAMAATR